jgi:hypothetical protein
LDNALFVFKEGIAGKPISGIASGEKLFVEHPSGIKSREILNSTGGSLIVVDIFPVRAKALFEVLDFGYGMIFRGEAEFPLGQLETLLDFTF